MKLSKFIKELEKIETEEKDKGRDHNIKLIEEYKYGEKAIWVHIGEIGDEVIYSIEV